MSGELLLIIIVSLIAFGPSKLPMLASDLGLILRKIGRLKEQASLFWQQQLQEQRLKENEHKAKLVDKQYKE